MSLGPRAIQTAFNTLPIELNKAIAHYLDTDKDIISFRLICRGTNDAIDADHGSFWRHEFRRKYAFKEGPSNKELQRAYQRRAKMLRRGTGYDYFRGYKKREQDVIEVLRDLIVDSFQGTVDFDKYGRPRCKNQDRLLEFIMNSKILLNDRRAPDVRTRSEKTVKKDTNPMLAAVKIICSSLLFEHDNLKHHVFAIEQLQRAAYASTNKAPIYEGLKLTDVNMEWIMKCLDFFRYHMMNRETFTLADAMEDLSALQKPTAWQEPLRNGALPLSKHWKGTYSFLDPKEQTKLRALPDDDDSDTYFSDKNIDEGKIQSLELDFEPKRQLKWPKLFEQRLNSLRETSEPDMPQCRSKAKYSVNANLQFTGTGMDLEDDFHAIGWLNALPDQCGIPGWQRITFMKHFAEDLDDVDSDNLWAYEGVVLPGGRIIVGRWWFASETVNYRDDYNGPFILWAAEPDEFEESNDSDSEE
ncbi:uncharacterized protein M421DRAFT_58030 [Didymella exigua CBS 183.55]|uniref:F-box domain-containing protein n=1 Tax=Didymella exigua CBS 183.55 TaxID=1150837 RepID=A0A6A5RWZ5_9PLEO|nr:uncharacterized protein M421DRAFT_58030 [Didymella exigua CBS 183.55]KAF1930806.1 hypothetical protein M421DRAFT_58030 [Didymella exigua CBS 183.55]